MNLFNSMRTAVSGMAAQSNALTAVSENIANSSTTGYKDAQAQFETLLNNNAGSNYDSGGVKTAMRYSINAQGTPELTTSPTDLAINGNGFFVVSQPGTAGTPGSDFMTRAGSFVPNTAGNLVNTAGYQLMGNAINPDGTTSSSLSVITLNTQTLPAAASTTGTLSVNLPSSATAVAAAQLPSTNSASATYTDKTSITVFDKTGNADVLDVYLTNTGPNTWEATAYPQSAAAASGGFPYSTGNVGTQTMTFNATTGALTSSPTSLTLNVPNGNSAVPINLSGTTQLAAGYSVTTASADGNAQSKFDHVQVGADGTLTEVYASGYQKAAYKIPLATVESPNNLTVLSGNVYQTNQNSGPMQTSNSGSDGVGTIQSDALEQSTVDIATELTNMISAQRAYEANSKVLQTASSLLGVLNNLNTN